MARFKNQVSKGIEDKPEARTHFLEVGSQDAGGQVTKPQTEAGSTSQYNESDMELVNVAGFKVPYVVREHWKAECRKKRVKLSPMLKSFLTEEFGLPPGFSLEDL